MRFQFNRLASATVSNGAQTVTLAQNSYDERAITAVSGLQQHDGPNFPASYILRGNLTTSVTPGATTQFWYDVTGTVTKTSDAQGHVVDVTSDSNRNYAVPSVVTPNTQSGLATSFSHSAFLGLTSQTAPNNAQHTINYDGYGRVSNTRTPEGVVTNFTYTYNPAVQTGTNPDGRFTKSTQDGLGRTVRVETGDAAGAKSIVDTEYDSCACSPIGKVKRVSQPYAPGGTPVWTTYSYDALGRTLSVTLPDGSASSTAYLANTTTATDPAGKWKKYTIDGLGNLTKVEEPNPAGGANLEAFYAYDAMNHLTQTSITRAAVTQTRSFVYNSNQRLQSATLPESGTTTYAYNADGTVASKTDAKNQRTEYTYDTLQRVTKTRRFLSSGSEDVCQQTHFYWDQNLFSGVTQWGTGRMAAVQWFVPTGSGCASGYRFTLMFSYNPAGQVTRKQLYVRTDSAWPAFSSDVGPYRELRYLYDTTGRLYRMEDSDNRFYEYTFDALWRAIQLDNGSGYPLIKDVTYNIAGQLTSFKNRIGGASVSVSYYTHTMNYNARLHLTQLTATPPPALPGGLSVNLEYRFPATQNNGQLWQEKDWVSGEEVTYAYDELHRLISASTTGPEWGLSWAFDGFGNRTGQTVTKGSGPSSALTYNLANNRLTSSGFGSDSNGNLTALPGQTLSYDVANRLLTADGSFGSERYGYTPDNQRVWRRKADGSEEFYLYGIGGQRVETFQRLGSGDLQAVASNIYFAGRLVRTHGPAGTWEEKAVITDRLGSVRLRSGYTGSTPQQESFRYYPYGEERTASPQDREKFATYSRDSNTGLDYAINRYYGSSMGRFLTPDPYGGSGKPDNPQSWNRYGYVDNDPVNYTDPSGLRKFDFEPDYGHGASSSSGIEAGGTIYVNVYGNPYNTSGGVGGGGGDGIDESAPGQAGAPDEVIPTPAVLKNYEKVMNCNQTAESLMKEIQSDFSQFGNFEGSWGPGGLPVNHSILRFGGGGGPVPVTAGEKIQITNTTTILGGPSDILSTSVTATSVSASGFSFTTTDGHLLYPATISFNASAIEGGMGPLTFSINVGGNFASEAARFLYKLGGYNLEDQIWNNFMGNVSKACGNSP